MSRSIVADFRTILRKFKHMPSLNKRDSPMRKLFLEKVHAGKLETDKNKINALLAAAHQYASQLSHVHELKYLRGLDSGEKLSPRDKIKATASRVGLGVPNFADETAFFARAGAESSFGKQ